MSGPVKPFERRNIALKIEYDGSFFSGWQRQPHLPSVQAIIEDELTALLHRKVVIYGAGRTDSGVHARAQIANFWGDSRFAEEQWAKILNFKLPKSIRIIKSAVLDDSFHSQKLAIGKTYEYFILNRRTESALNRHAYFYPKTIDWARTEEALQYFLGPHDFVSFQGAKATVRTTVRTVSTFTLERKTDDLFRFEISGKGFLKQMVRTMIGTVLEVGEGKRNPSDISKILAAKDRRAAGRTVPANGLCLVKVYYPKPFDLF